MASARMTAATGLLALTLWVSGAAVSQQPKKGDPKTDPQQAVEPKSAPGAGQKFLARFAGDWDVAKKFFPRDGGDPKATAGTCKQEMTHGGRFLKSEFEFGTGAAKSTGTGVIGFEPATGLFTSTWYDSRQTRMSFRRSKEKFTGDKIVLFGNDLGGEPERKSKTVTTLAETGNTIVHRQYAIDQEGKERLMMELVMTRKSK